MLKTQNYTNLHKLLASLVLIAGVNAVIIPVEAQQGGALNPSPSIFNEPPYNRSRNTAPTPETTPSTPTTPSTETTPETTPSTPTTPSTETTPEASPSMPSMPSSDGATSGSDNVVAIAAANDSFKTLTAALKAAGLTETLAGAGPFTVFAPTDAAFAALPQDALQELLKPENKEVLVKILTYHVVPGKVTSSDLKSGEVKTVEGGGVNVKVDSATGVTVNDAKVVQPDIQASNGVIHVIDKVILPPDL
jgi:uncharacterized surface protein with fasciclin (FAS1) repeats